MKTIRSMIVALMAVFLALPVIAEIPEMLFRERIPAGKSSGEGYPMWVSAAKALGPGSRVDRESFRADAAEDIEEYLKRNPEDGCIGGWTPGHRLPGRGWTSLRSAIQEAEWVFIGTVTAQKGGFWARGAPGSVFEVMPDRTFKGPTDRQWEHFFWFGRSRFRWGDLEFCPSNHFAAGEVTVGQRVFLIISDVEAKLGGLLDTRIEMGVLPIEEGAVLLPRDFLNDPDLPVLRGEDDIAALAKEILVKEKKR